MCFWTAWPGCQQPKEVHALHIFSLYWSLHLALHICNILNEHSSIFVLWQPVDWLIYECHMFLYSRCILQYPLSKTTTAQLKDSTCKVIPREMEPHRESHINFWEVSHSTNKARMRFCYVFWNWPHLLAFVIEHCAPGCNCEWFLQCTRTVC